MLKKTMTYTDYDGNQRTEDFYFNLNKAELVEMENSREGGLDKAIKTIIASHDRTQLISMFKNIILASYGEKSPDGKRFVKSKELSTGFSQTEAYSQLFMELSSDSKAAAAFVNGIVPQEMPVQNTVSNMTPLSSGASQG